MGWSGVRDAGRRMREPTGREEFLVGHVRYPSTRGKPASFSLSILTTPVGAGSSTFPSEFVTVQHDQWRRRSRDGPETPTGD
jgi:hypothetical protein